MAALPGDTSDGAVHAQWGSWGRAGIRWTWRGPSQCCLDAPLDQAVPPLQAATPRLLLYRPKQQPASMREEVKNT